MKLSKEQRRVAAGILGEILIARLRECWREEDAFSQAHLPRPKFPNELNFADEKTFNEFLAYPLPAQSPELSQNLWLAYQRLFPPPILSGPQDDPVPAPSARPGWLANVFLAPSGRALLIGLALGLSVGVFGSWCVLS